LETDCLPLWFRCLHAEAEFLFPLEASAVVRDEQWGQ
jgi:hypothetical protein